MRRPARSPTLANTASCSSPNRAAPEAGSPVGDQGRERHGREAGPADLVDHRLEEERDGDVDQLGGDQEGQGDQHAHAQLERIARPQIAAPPAASAHRQPDVPPPAQTATPPSTCQPRRTIEAPGQPRYGGGRWRRLLGEFDYVVVGAGTAGCLLANRLSADPRQPRAAARGRRARLLSLDPHPRRLPLLHRQPAHRLVLQDRARARAQRPRAELSARQGAGRLLRDQRHDLHARPGARLRPLAPARQRRAGAGTTCCPTSSSTEDHWPGAERVPRRRRRMAGRAAAPALGDPRRLPRRAPSSAASPRPTTSTAATTRAAATSRSTSAAACAGTRPRPSCGPARGRAEPRAC